MPFHTNLMLINIQKIEIEEISKMIELLLNNNYYSGRTIQAKGPHAARGPPV
jgi:hypothetical protein